METGKLNDTGFNGAALFRPEENSQRSRCCSFSSMFDKKRMPANGLFCYVDN